MIEQSVLENPKVDQMIALHVFPDLEAGKIGFRPGMYMASCDELYVTIKGKGGHAALPHQNIDPILITSHIITALQQLISRTMPPTIPAVLSFGKIIGNGATNIIPDCVKLEGTFRAMNEEWRYREIDKSAYYRNSFLGKLYHQYNIPCTSCKVPIKTNLMYRLKEIYRFGTTQIKSILK